MAKDPEDLEEIEEEDDGDEDDIDVAEEEAALPTAEDDDEETSLEELLAQRAAGKKGAAEESEDETDIMALTSEPQVIPNIDALTGKVIPIKDRQEFVCNRCHLVKLRSQLADADRGLCRDCV